MRGFFYQAAEYSKLFPSIEDAKEAIEDTEAYVSMRESIISGDSSNFIDALKSQSEQTVESFGYDFLCKLAEKDNKSFVTIITPLYENVIRRMAADSDENTQAAATVLSQFLFGTPEVAEGKKTFSKKIESPKKRTDDPTVLNSAYQDVAGKTNRALSVIIGDGLDDLSPFIKKSVVNSCLEEIWNTLSKDQNHMSIMKNRWTRASINSYSDDDKTKIISTLLVRARPLIPSIRAKLVNEALGTSKKVSDEKTKKIESGINKEISGGISNSRGKSNSDNSKSSNGKDEKVNYRKMTDLEILNSN